MTAALLLLVALAPARAAESPQPTAVFSPDRKAKDEPMPAAQAIALAFGATFFAEVKISTAGPVTDLSRLAHEGFYKRELITLLLISAKAKKPLQEVVAKRKGKKKNSFKEIAGAYGLDYDAIYEAALAVEEVVDRDYLPRFPERRPHQERNEP